MTDFVSIEDCRYHLRLDADSNGGADDGWLAIFIPAISSAVALWLKDEWRAFVCMLDSNGDYIVDSNEDPIPIIDSNGDMTVQPVVRAACLVEIGSQFRFREGEGDNVVPADAGHGYILSKGATALLAGLRMSTVR